MWFVLDGDEPHLLVRKVFRKLREISIPELRAANPAAVILTHKRFFELKDPDKKLDIVIGKSYRDQIPVISKATGFPYKEVE